MHDDVSDTWRVLSFSTLRRNNARGATTLCGQRQLSEENIAAIIKLRLCLDVPKQDYKLLRFNRKYTDSFSKGDWMTAWHWVNWLEQRWHSNNRHVLRFRQITSNCLFIVKAAVQAFLHVYWSNLLDTRKINWKLKKNLKIDQRQLFK